MTRIMLFFKPLNKLFIHKDVPGCYPYIHTYVRTYVLHNVAGSGDTGREGGRGDAMSNLWGDKEVVLLRLSQCKHHTASTLMHEHPASGWVLIRKHGRAPSVGPYHHPFMDTHTHTHTHTHRHSWGHYSCLCSEWQPFISVCLQAKWLSSMHPTIRKCHKRTHKHANTHMCTKARTDTHTHVFFLQEMRSN